jgi:hypothetical protein
MTQGISEQAGQLIKLVVLESPYKGEVEENLVYARACALDCARRGESVQASHLLFTQFLDDTVPAERELGIALGLAWTRVADYSVFYTDRGWSTGMLRALDAAWFRRKQVKIRSLNSATIIMPIIRSADQWDWTFLQMDHTKAPEAKT